MITNNLRYILIILLGPLLMVLLWFGDGHIMGTAESGLSFYNLTATQNLARYSWSDVGLSNYTGGVTASWPTFWFLSRLEGVGIPGFVIEALTFYFVLAVAGVAIYLFTKFMFPKMSDFFALLATLFYWFNPLIIVNFWKRFLLDFIFFYAFFPLFLLIFIKGIYKKDYKYAIGLAVVSVFFSFAFSAMANIFFLVIVLLLTVGFYILKDTRKNRLFIIKYSILFIVLFILVNAWWISQTTYLAASRDFEMAVNRFASPLGNLDNLTSVSRILGQLSNIFRFEHTFYSLSTNVLKILSQSLFFTLIEYFITLFILFGMIIARKKKSVLYLSILMFFGYFLMKGNAPPLGEVFQYIFLKFSPFQLFRNPFEKFTTLVVLPAALLFGFTSWRASNLMRNVVVKKIFLSSLIVILAGFWGFSLWAGLVFSHPQDDRGYKNMSYDVEVPIYYKEASEWLQSQGSDFRFISFPLGGEGIVYTWPHAYRGVELSYILFHVTNISNATTVLYFNTVARGLEQNFLEGDGFDKVMSSINARYIVLRKDIDWKVERMRDPEVIQKKLEDSKDFEKVAEFGALSFWEYKGWQKTIIYAANKYISALPLASVFDLANVSTDGETILINPTNGKESQVIVHPTFKMYFTTKPITQFEIDQKIFPHVSTLPTSNTYPLTLIKEQLTLLNINNRVEKAEYLMLLLGKRLVEAKLTAERGDILGVDKALDNYNKQLATFENTLKLIGASGEGSLTYWRQEELANIFAKHLSVLEGLNGVSTKIDILSKDIKDLLKRYMIIPENDFIQNESFPVTHRSIYRFEVPVNGDYSVLLPVKTWQKKLAENLEYIQLDNVVYKVNSDFNDRGGVSLGTYNLAQGWHELSFNTLEEQNLISIPEEINLFVEHGEKEFTFEIQELDPYSVYELSLDYFIKKGAGFKISIEADNDPVVDGKKIPYFSKEFIPDGYNFGEQSFRGGATLAPNSTTAKLVMRAKPVNECEKLYKNKRVNRCNEENFSLPYDKATEVVVKNLTLKKILNTEPFMISRFRDRDEGAVPTISYEKDGPAAYKVTVKNATNSFMLVFAQLYHTGWIARYEDGEIIDSKSHYLVDGFANGWMVDRYGDFEIFIEHEPQKYLSLGKNISAVSVIFSTLFLVIRRRNKRKYVN